MSFSSSLLAQTGPNDDFDGDGIINSIDLDDDNDGILDTEEMITTINCSPVNGASTQLRAIVWDQEQERTLSTDFSYISNKNGYQPLIGPGLTKVTGPAANGRDWAVTGANNNGTIADANAKGDYQYGQFTVGAKALIIDYWCFYTIQSGAKIAVAFDDDITNFASPQILTSGTPGPTGYTTSYNSGDGSWSMVPGSRVILKPNTTYQVRFYNLGTVPYYGHDLLGFGFYEASTTCQYVYTSQDTDADGIPNERDLDSDGDGCFDALEGAERVFSANVDANGKILGAVDSNGVPVLVNYGGAGDVDGFLGQGKGYSQLSTNTTSCTDTDSDGLPDEDDIDDDNDGIPDAIEIAACNIPVNTFNYKSTIIATTGATVNTGNVQSSLNGTENNDFYYTTQTLSNTNILTYQFPTAINLTGFEVAVNSAFITSGSMVKVQGSNNGNTWTDITSSFDPGAVGTSTYGLTTNSTQKFTFTSNTNKYVYYRLLGVSGGISSGPWILETYFSPIVPTSCDLDGDGISNEKDLDSDGDGCSDAKEARVSPEASLQASGNLSSARFVFTSPTNDANKDGLYDGASQIYYSSYAVTNLINSCSDFDNDGVNDITDLDDDNDGVLDAVESPACFYTAAQASAITSVTSELTPYFSYNTTYSYDNNIATFSGFSNSQDWVGKTIFEIVPFRAVPLKFLNINVGSYALSSSATSTFKLQGYQGISWVDLSSPVANTTTNVIFPIASSDTSTVYSKFRLIGVSGTNTWSYINELILEPSKQFQSSLYPKEVCTVDSDNDGIPNQLDLDSDGDGCSDALEGGATTNTIANYQFTGAVGANGLVNSLETVADNGVVNYNLTYTLYGLDATLNVCADSDNDGISDLVDIDDDNDGILDAVESPSCFYTATEISQIQTVSSELASYSTYLTSNTIDQSSSTLNAFTPSVNWIGKELYKVSTLRSFSLVSMSLDLSTWAISNSASNTFKLQGSTDNVSWTDLSGAVSSTATTGTFVITNSLAPAGLFKYYRLIGVAGTSYYGGVSEIKLNVATTYNPSSYPKGGCIADVDSDGKLNHLDLDSDGDGCSDAKEGGATTSNTANYQFTGAVGTNGLVNSLETAVDNGVINYSSTYTQYALVSSINACVDTDNDGIADIVDIDDDNDGVLDTTEDCDASSSTTNQLNTSVKFTSAPTTVSGDSQIGYSYTPTGISFNPGASVGQHNGVALLGPFTSTGVAVNVIAIVRKDWGVSSYGGTVNGLFEILDNSQSVVVSLTWQDNTSNGSTDANNQTISFSGTVPTGNYYIRIKDNGSTSTSSGWGDDWSVKELTISTQKCNWDFDNDGIPNRLDLDSDGDGCSDAYESGATASVVPNYQFIGAVGTNGLVNSLETAVDNGVLNYTSTYSKALNNSIHTCPSCVAGTVAPALSSTTRVGVCPSTTIDLTSITSSNLPAGTVLTWHTGSIASGANKVANPSAVAGGTYYASFFDSANNCYSPTTLVTATSASCASGVIDCSKTQLYPAPVVGVSGQKVLYVTLNVSTSGCFSPLSLIGSGFSVGNGVTQVCTTTTGVQQMSIPVYYNGSSLGTMSFTVGTSGSCSADLTTTPKKTVVDMWTIECLPTQGPVLR